MNTVSHKHTHNFEPRMLLNYTLFFSIKSESYTPMWPDQGSGQESRGLSLFEAIVRSLLQIRAYGYYFSVPKPGSDSGHIWKRIMVSGSRYTMYLL